MGKGSDAVRRGRRGAVILAALLVAALALSLAPLLRASFYAHPAADDYSYGLNVRRAVQGGGGALDVFAAAARQVKESYFGWQGSFASVFLFALMPAAFSDDLYFLTTFLLTGALVLSTLYLMDALVVRWLRGRRSWAVALGAATLIMQIQFVPYKAEGLFWFNGGCYYTLFFAFAQTLAALLIRAAARGRAGLGGTAAALALALLIGGGNYSTALISLELLTLALVALALRRNAAWRLALMALLVMLAAFAVSAVAPGNAVRASISRHLSAPVAIARSIVKLAQYIGNWTHLPQLVFLALVAPVLYFLSLRCDWSFRAPLLACALAFLLCASQFTPPYFATGGQGGGRQVDIYYYSYYLLMLFCEFYLCGWLARRGAIDSARLRALCLRHFAAAVVALAALFAMGCCGQARSMSGVEVSLSLLRGEPQRFDAQYEAWVAQARAGGAKAEIPDVDVPDYFVNPWSAWVEDAAEPLFNGNLLTFYDIPLE